MKKKIVMRKCKLEGIQRNQERFETVTFYKRTIYAAAGGLKKVQRSFATAFRLTFFEVSQRFLQT